MREFWNSLDPEIQASWKIAGLGLFISAILFGYAATKEVLDDHTERA